ncbi:RNA-directed DNA polymerase, eukaryota [Tanacetum coccineum]|uniref:RNA-directed DNA polymerase, eukaryota n=1 Tax=Tanacetum coccineum TaxID=301880 RepID=A0ABQ4ZZG6_9ASTR
MDTRLLKEELTRILIWVKLHDVPIQVFEEDGISLIDTFIGKPVMLDLYTSSMCNDSWGRSSFARCLIEENSEADLVDVVTIGIPSLSEDDFTKETIRVDYEWRPPRCDTCKIFSHVHDYCPKKVVSPPIVATSNVVTPNTEKTNDGFQTVGKTKKRKGKSKSTNGGQFTGFSIKHNTTGNSSKKDNLSMSNSFSALNEEEEDEEDVKNVYDESANLIQNTKAGESSSFTAAAETYSSRDLWKVCNDYGSVVDAFILIGRFHIHANVACFNRPLKPNTSIPRTSDFGTSKTSFTSVLKEGYHKEIVNSNPALVLDDTCIKDHDFSLSLMGKVSNVTAIPNLYSILFNEGFHSTKITYLRRTWVLLVTDSIESKDKLLNHTGDDFVGDKDKIDSSDIDRLSESSFSHVNDLVHDIDNNNVAADVGSHSDDPFNLYGILNNQHKKANDSSTAKPEYPLDSLRLIIKTTTLLLVNSKEGGSILDVMEEIIKVRHTMGYNMEGTWVPTSTKLLIISVYAPQELTEKCDLWNYLRSLIDMWDGETVIMGDFNEVHYEHERFGSTFNSQGANAFNNFISLAEGFDSFVESTWKSMHVTDSNGLVRMKKKLQLLKSAIKVWIKETKARSYEKKINILQNLSEADKSIDRGLGNEEIILKRTKLLKELQELNYLDASEISQKAKVRWSIEGDENTKYFHGILNKKRSQLAIRGTLVNGEWISNPVGVKREFYSHFKNQFSPSYTPRLSFDFVFPNRLSTDQVEDLERLVTYDEVKRAVWDCGANKSPGPDGFTFEFFRKFWKTLDQDVFQAVSDFFENGHIPRGCNASFIALIPKIHDAKIVKDFRPISLIGSIYKIITKILANRLCNVLPCLISEVQSAFVSNRNILDGPFILDELLQWCKHKRKRAMIFKVDFEKAFDSVKWDYLIDTLRAFGFGQKWCSWINGCFETATGSVLVNGSPTSEFQFHRGLKQGDPISPFLFILIMETLHLSFKRVIEANLFKGISINASFSISHLFYADDVVFIGEWNSSNIKTVAKVLNCFYLASGLKINFHKSKLMGVGVNSNEVESVANLVGCSTFSSPFKYLGVIVGDNMSRLKPWEDVISKVSNRLSNWKLKTLSIGGRLTLIKSVISSIPLYHMSIFKAPMGVLNKLESIRRNFFNGIDGMDKKNSWIGWDKILASKKNGGLGVSSLYATNRALLFKWIWRFFSQDSSWWSRFIQAMHGNHGALSSCVTSLRRSPWLDIIREMHALNSKGIDLMQFLKKKLGNGENTSFWDDKWHDDGPFKSLYPRLHALETCKSISVASKLSQPSLIHSFRRPPRGGVEEEQFSLLGSRTTGISLPNMCDRWFWSLESSGDFSVKSTRICIDDNILPKNDVPTRWVKIIPIKVNIHAWKVFLDKIPTRLNLSLRGMDIPSILCPLCNSAAESTSHIFFSCPLARQVWNKFLRWWEMDSISFDRYEDWLSWLNNTRFPKQLKTFLEGICYIMWWLIWRFRNQVLFGSKQPRRDLLFDDIVQLSYLWISNRSPC